MPTMTTNTPLISNANLAARLQNFISELSNPAALDTTRELQQIAEDQSLDIGPVLDTFAQKLLDGKSSQPETTTELLENFSRFITQGIADLEQKALAFEQKFITTFLNHPIMRLRHQSFRKGALDMTNSALESAVNLVAELTMESHALEEDICDLQQAFNDSDGRIIAAHSCVHTITNKLTVILGYAQELRHKNLDSSTRRKFLQAIQTNIRGFTEANRSVFERDPIEFFSEANPHVEVIVKGCTPTFFDPQHRLFIVTTLEHLTDNAFNAGATYVKIQAEWEPTDTVFAIGIEDDVPGGIPEATLRQLINRKGGSGWNILRELTFPRLGAHVEITSPFQNGESGPYGTLVMLFIPVMAQTGDEPGTSRRRKADSGPLSAVSTLTPSAPLPAVQRPVSMAAGLAPSLASAASCFTEQPVGVILKFPNLK